MIVGARNLINPNDFPFVTLRFLSEMYVGHLAHDPDNDYVTTYDAEIVLDVWDEGVLEKKVIGKMQGAVVHVRHAGHESVWLDALDSMSRDAFECGAVMSMPWAQAVLEVPYGDFFILQSVEIDKEYRGQDIGLAAAWTFIRKMAVGCSTAILKPFPLQYSAQHGGDAHRGLEFHASKAKVAAHWARLGFRPVMAMIEEEYMYLDIERIQPMIWTTEAEARERREAWFKETYAMPEEAQAAQ